MTVCLYVINESIKSKLNGEGSTKYVYLYVVSMAQCQIAVLCQAIVMSILDPDTRVTPVSDPWVHHGPMSVGATRLALGVQLEGHIPLGTTAAQKPG